MTSPAPRSDASDEPSRPASRPFARSRLPRIVAVSLAFCLVLGGASVGVATYKYRSLDSSLGHEPSGVLNTSDPAIVNPKVQLNAANFLVIGSDDRAGTKGAGKVDGQRSDTTMLVHLNPSHTKSTIVSIPRDSWVTIPDCKDAKGVDHPEHKGMFNSAFAEAGAGCTVATIQRLTGIAVNHYVEMNFAGFQKVVDALGGVTICSPTALVHPEKDVHLVLKAGNNKLNGVSALEYVRLRHIGTGSDLDRIERQQRFLGAVLRQARSGSLLTNPIRLNEFLNATVKAITVDQATHLSDLQTLFKALRGLDPKRVTFYTAPIANAAYDPNNPSNPKGSRVLLNTKLGRILYDEIINDSKVTTSTKSPSASASKSAAATAPTTVTVAPDAIAVDVLNATTTSGLARSVETKLTALGFKGGTVGTAPANTTATVVEYRAAQAAAARTVAAAFPNSTLKLSSAHTGAITVAVGKQYSQVRTVAAGQALPSWVKVAAGAPTSSAGTSAASKTPTATPTGGISASDTKCTL